MIGEISVVPQMEGPTRKIVAEAVEEIAERGLRYEVAAAGTCVEGDLEDILSAVRGITTRLGGDGVDRAVIDLRLLLEPHAETLEHQVEGIAPERTPAGRRSESNPSLGLPEQDLREALEEELLRSIRVEGDVPTVHAIAHSVARILEQDHLRLAEQLERAGVHLQGPAVEA